MPNLFTLQEDRRFVAVAGRIYSPLYLSPEVQDQRTSNKLALLTPQALKNAEGNFVLVSYSVIDDAEETVTISVDKFGTRLALYCVRGNCLYFATHISGLIYLLGDRPPPFSTEALFHYYHFGFTPGDRTLWEGIHKITPGASIIIGDGRWHIERYFDLSQLYMPREFDKKGEQSIINDISSFLDGAIARRNPDKKRTALALSGGVDSGFIAKKLYQAGISLTGYNLAYGEYYNEFDRVERLEKEYPILIRKIKATPQQILDQVESANGLSSEPVKFNDAALFLLAGEAKKDGFDSLWDGDGADRLFFGMNRQLQYLRLLKAYKFIKLLRLAPLARFFLKKARQPEGQKLYRLLENWQNGIPPYPERKIDLLSPYNITREKYIFELAIQKHWESYASGFPKANVPLYFTYQSIMMCPEMFFYPPAELQNSLELFPISPYWSDPLVSLALSIPLKWKTKEKKTKYILRKAASSGEDEKYWMSPKIGLQSAFDFCMASASGREWREKRRKIVREAEEYELIQRHVDRAEVDVDRLLSLNLWREKNRT